MLPCSGYFADLATVAQPREDARGIVSAPAMVFDSRKALQDADDV
jgi:hypothetical protein